VNELVDCKDKMGGWYPASILKTKEKEIQVHYINYSDRWDEWIKKDSDRLARLGKNSAKRVQQVVREHDIGEN
jgi:hypothetical protein